ncbi:hypothetical protein OHA37_40685 (plasmid) [Streptomyces sp. NBC_00335]|uniref:hypothetical protein n=1 Tax=unclassified Streptomyces TaxID=2593676 RepID=UPI0022507F99|nr:MULTISPECIES: hypothetical protein [unclassified Streptomyces]MCX5410146.1 hypothetical protein [Streptomyces sp. NBC_00086]
MDRIIDFIKAEPEAAAVFAALISILGGFLGSLLSGWIQVRGGLAQASAAVQASRITAEAQHLATLHTDRRREIAAFVYEAQQCADAANAVFLPSDPTTQAASEASGQAAGKAVRIKQAELQLIAPSEIVELTAAVIKSLSALRVLSARGVAARVEYELLGRGHRNATDREEACVRALVALRELRQRVQESDSPARKVELSAALATALSEVPGLSDVQRVMLQIDGTLPALRPLRSQANRAYEAALGELVAASRTLLRSDDRQPD